MEGGGPGLGAAVPQYEEQLLHTQVGTSTSLVFLCDFSPKKSEMLLFKRVTLSQVTVT